MGIREEAGAPFLYHPQNAQTAEDPPWVLRHWLDAKMAGGRMECDVCKDATVGRPRLAEFVYRLANVEIALCLSCARKPASIIEAKLAAKRFKATGCSSLEKPKP